MKNLFAFAVVAIVIWVSMQVYAQPVNPDPTFMIGTGANNTIHAMVVLNDDRIIIGGEFSSYNGNTRNRIARLLPDGTIESPTTFNTGSGFNGPVFALALQSDGKILVGGNFTSYNGTACNRIVRLNTDGTIDNTFNIGSGCNNPVYAIAVQSDGKILVGGDFTTYGSMFSFVPRLVRLETNGTRDTGFTPPSFNASIRTIAISSAGIYVGGDFTAPTNGIVRLTTSGSQDTSFGVGSGFDATVRCIVVQPTDNKVLVGGDFIQYNGASPRNRIIRLETNGNADAVFVTNMGSACDNSVYAIYVAPNGRITLGGDFTSYNGNSCGRIVRLNSNGAIDASFFSAGSGFNILVRALRRQNNPLFAYTTLVAGNFTSYNGSSYNRIIRLIQCPSVIVSPMQIPGTIYNSPYSQTFSQVGLTFPTWSLVGSLPPGLSFNPATATISGTTTASGVYNFFIQLNEGGCSYSFPYTLFCSQMIFSQVTGSPFTTGAPIIDAIKDAKTGDFNRDGLADVIFSTSLMGANALRIKLGDEAGTFTGTAENVGVAADSAKAIAVYDINKDGLLDAVVTKSNGGGGGFASYLKGSYAPPYLGEYQSSISLGPSPALMIQRGLNDVVLADMDNDSDMDLVTAGIAFDGTDYYISLRVAFYDHTSDIFGSPIVANVSITAPIPNHVFADVGDIDNDGFIDVAVATNKANTHPIWFRNNGGTSFTSYNVVGVITYSGGMRGIKIGDFNNDGREDVVLIANNGSRDVFRYYVNNGGSLPSRFNFPSNLPPSDSDIPINSMRRMIVADLDNDKDLDVAVTAREGSTGRLAVIRNNPTGSFQLDTYQNTVSNNPFAITHGDFNRDGKEDIALLDRTTNNSMYVWLNSSAPAVAPAIGNFSLLLRGAMNERGETQETIITKNTDFTVEGWVNLNRHSANQFIFYNGIFGTNGFGLYVPANTREIRLISYQAGVPTDISANINPSGDDFVNGRWNHFAFGRKDNGEWFFFWNGNNNTFGGTPPTHNFTSPSAGDKTFFAWNGFAGTLISRGGLDEFRFWNKTLEQAEVQEWMNLKANPSHPQASNISAHYDFNISPAAGATIAFDEAEKIYPSARKRNATFVLAYPSTPDSNWTKKIAPVGNFGSSRSLYVDGTNQASVLDFDPQTAVRILFNSAIHPTGWIVVTRILEHPSDLPNPTGVPKVYWTIRNYGTPQVFDPVEMLRLRLTQLQCDEAITSAIPLPNPGNYTNYYLATRPIGSNNPSDWNFIGPANAYGTLQYRRPASTVNEFGREYVPTYSTTPLFYEDILLQGRKISPKTNELRWKLENYLAVGEIYVQKSLDALHFKTIGKVQPHNENSYTFLDNDALQAAYYRIYCRKNEKTSYSNIIYIDVFQENSPLVVFPNPVELKAEVQIKGVGEEGKWMIVDNLGVVLLEAHCSATEFEKKLQEFVNTRNAGLYMLIYSNDKERKSTKFVIK